MRRGRKLVALAVSVWCVACNGGRPGTLTSSEYADERAEIVCELQVECSSAASFLDPEERATRLAECIARTREEWNHSFTSAENFGLRFDSECANQQLELWTEATCDGPSTALTECPVPCPVFAGDRKLGEPCRSLFQYGDCESGLECDKSFDVCRDPCPPPPGSVELPDPSTLPGLYFLALSTGIDTAEQFPILSQLEIDTAEAQPDSSVRGTLRYRGVAACEQTREVEAFSDSIEFHLTSEALVIDLPEHTFPLEANPILPAAQRWDIQLTLTSTDPNLPCGRLTGEVYEPVMQSLQGTFAMHPVSAHGEVPAELYFACEMLPVASEQSRPACEP